MAIDIFMVFETPKSGNFTPGDFKGETLDTAFAGATEVTDISWSIENQTTIGSATSGAGAGKASFKEVTVTKQVDRLSVKLLQVAGLGTNFPSVTISFRKSGGASGAPAKPYYTVTMRLVFLTKVERSASGGENSIQETLTFAVGSIAEQFVPQSASGSSLPAINGSWNQVKNIVDPTNVITG